VPVPVLVPVLVVPALVPVAVVVTRNAVAVAAGRVVTRATPHRRRRRPHKRLATVLPLPLLLLAVWMCTLG